MASCSPGDQVICYLKDGHIVSVYDNEWQDKSIFDIVSLYEEGYMLYVSEDIRLIDAILLTKTNYTKFNADKKFIGSYIYYITDHKIVSIYSKLDGICCIKCETFCRMAEPNQPDGRSFICWNCVKYPHYL